MKKINIANILKHCPKGMKLDCTIWGWNIEFDHINIKDEDYPIVCHDKLPDGKYNIRTFTKYGYYSISDSKCVIFPKGETTWEGFAPPCKFKDGDVLYIRSVNPWICIYKEGGEIANVYYKYVATSFSAFVHDDSMLCHREHVREIRFATEEEKAKLFQVIKDNGYKWNAETKTLEKLIQPHFKVGDRIKHIKTCNIYEIIKIISNYYITNYLGSDIMISFNKQDEYELVPNKFSINTLKPFKSKVLVRDYDNRMWIPTFWGKHLEDNSNCSYLTTNGCYKYCIPYEGNEHLLGTTDNCDEYYKTWN